ncbi:MAG: hypothetical protein SFU99_21925, partial [Saprospiraceae bacterium]|nr:hypothetical protein [Saprospiraceae bacterium]
MNLIIDSGATKAKWALSEIGEAVQQVYTQGLHPLLMPEETMRLLMQEAQLKGITPSENIFYYGTGCKSEDARRRIHAILQESFPTATRVEVDTDVFGAARALCQHDPGIACILGTGSNSCFYDGERILANKGGHGFILGDEGSGAALGKQLMADLKAELEQNPNFFGLPINDILTIDGVRANFDQGFFL